MGKQRGRTTKGKEREKEREERRVVRCMALRSDH